MTMYMNKIWSDHNKASASLSVLMHSPNHVGNLTLGGAPYEVAVY